MNATKNLNGAEQRELSALDYSGYVTVNPVLSPGFYRTLNSLYRKDLAIKSNRRLDGFYTFYSISNPPGKEMR